MVRIGLGVALTTSLIACSASPAAPGSTPLDRPDATGASTPVTPVSSDQPTPVASAPAPARSATPAPSAPVDDDHDGHPRIASIAHGTSIWEETRRPPGTLAVGAVRIGTSVRLRSATPVAGGDCRGKWYAIEPRGFICSDATTTLDLDSPYYRALAAVRPGPGPYPYRYAFSTGAPMYSRIPTPDEQAQAELTFGPKHTFATLGKWSEGHEWLVDKTGEITATDEVPSFLRGNDPVEGSPWHPHNPKVRVIPAGSGFSYARAFAHSGRVWLLTPELLLVPADRVFPYRPSEFHGVELGHGVDLPLAWVRSHEGVHRQRRVDGVFSLADATWAKHTPVALTGRTEVVNGVTFHETREADGSWLAETHDVSVVKAVDALHQGLRSDEKWLEARLLPGTMTAYVGKRPVWTTLWSGGKGGVPVKGLNPIRYATTSLGVFPFEWKDRVATMSPDRGAPTVFWFADVPHIQYVRAPLAMHVAYWHDRFGYLMSAECLNVSAADGQWLFDFTDPPLPPGWGSIAPSKNNGPSTRVHIKAY